MTSLPAWLSCADLTFQGSPNLTGEVPPKQVARLSTEAFPDCGPISLAATPDYGGLKLVGMGGYLALSHFDYRGAKDAHGRAVASARVLLIRQTALHHGLRDLQLLAKLLREDPDPAFPNEALISQLRDLEQTPATTPVAELASTYDLEPELICSAIACNLAFGKLILAGTDSTRAFRLMALLLMVLPVEHLLQQRWCSYAYRLAKPHEDLLIVPRALEAPPRQRSWLGRLLNRGNRLAPADPQLDCTNGRLLGVDERRAPFAAIRSGVATLLTKPSAEAAVPETQLREVRKDLHLLKKGTAP